jgi:hypothetical protein
MTDSSSNSGKTSNAGKNALILAFPTERAIPLAPRFADLGQSALSRQFGAPARQGTGHWCSRCRGIWFGYLLEVTCPKCGNRHG